MTDDLSIRLTGSDGSVWDLCGPNADSQGVLMRPKPSGLIDAPVKTMWIKSAFGQKYQGSNVQRRDVVFSVQIHGDNGTDWHAIDSRFRMALGNYDDQFTLTYLTGDGPRSLALRLLEQPKAYETDQYEDRDPHIWGDSTLLVTATAEQPYWFGTPAESTFTLTSGSSGMGLVTVSNPGDVPIWPRWTVTAPAAWTLPDWSWGQDDYNSAVADQARTVPLPTLRSGEDADLDSNPQEEALIAANGAPVWNRWNGNGLLYPIPPHTPPTQVPVSVAGAPVGATASVVCDRWYSRPWGVTR